MLDTLRDYIRPLTVLALIGNLLIGAIVAGVIEMVWPGQGVAFTEAVAGWFQAIPDSYYQLAGAGSVAYIASRGYQKGVEIKAKANYQSFDSPEGSE